MEKPNLTITISDDDFLALAEGKLNPQNVSIIWIYVCVYLYLYRSIDMTFKLGIHAR